MEIRVLRVLTLAILCVACSLIASGRTQVGSSGQRVKGGTGPVRPALVQLLPRWRQGDRMHFEIEKSRVKTQNGQVTSTMTSRTPLEIEVLEATATGHAVKWSFGETRFDDPKLDELMAKELGEFKKGSAVIFD